MAEILCSWGPGESRLALVADGRVVELAVDRPTLAAGAVFMGRVVEVATRLDACFVDIGRDRPGVLKGAGGRTVGQAILVQVQAESRPGKGPRLTADIRIPGRFFSYTGFRKGLRAPKALAAHLERCQRFLVDGDGATLRPAAPAASDEALAADLAGLRADWAVIEDRRKAVAAPALVWRPDAVTLMLADNPAVERVVFDDRAAFAAARHRLGDLACFAAGTVAAAEDAFAEALSPTVDLPGGGRLTIDEVTALTAIDVDSGAAAQADANRAAVAAIADALRLRRIGGQVVIDFVSTGDRRAVQRLADDLKRAVASDPVPTHVFGVTPLGLVELTRERRGPSLADLMLDRGVGLAPEAAALAALRRAVAEAAHRPGRALALVVAPRVAAALAARPEAVAEASARIGRPLALRPEPGREPEDFLIEEVT